VTSDVPADPARRAEFWLGAAERRQLVRSFGLLGGVTVAGGGTAVLAAPHTVAGAVIGGLVGLVALAALIVLLARVPVFLTRQGIVIEPAGLVLFADPAWWFSGWRLVLPAETVLAADRGQKSATLVLTLDRPVVVSGSPIWVTAAGPGQTPANGEPAADGHRLMLELLGPDADAIRTAIRQWRAAAPTNPAPRPPDDTFVSLRTGAVVRWALASLAGLAVTQVPLWSYVASGLPAGRADTLLVGLSVLAAAVVAVAVRFAPGALAEQGLTIGPSGVELRRDALGWQPGSRLRLAPESLRATTGTFVDHGPLVDPDQVRHGPLGPRPGSHLELILNTLPDTPALPGWARLVPPGVAARRLVTDRPRLLINAGDAPTAERLRYLVAKIVPELDDLADSDSEPVVRAVRWIAVPRRSVAPMITLLVVIMSLALGGWLGAFAFWPAMISRGLPLLAVPAVLWVGGRLLPERLARSGIQVEPAGLQLVRGSLAWLPELRRRLPWSEIRAVRVVRMFAPAAVPHGWPVEQAIELEVTDRARGRLPHWCRRSAAGIRLLIGDQATAHVVRELARHGRAV